MTSEDETEHHSLQHHLPYWFGYEGVSSMGPKTFPTSDRHLYTHWVTWKDGNNYTENLESLVIYSYYLAHKVMLSEPFGIY